MCLFTYNVNDYMLFEKRVRQYRKVKKIKYKPTLNVRGKY